MQQVLANMNPSDCTVVSFLSQQVVQPVGMWPGGLCPNHEGTQSCYFCFGFYFGTWEFICLEIKYVTVTIFDVLVLLRRDDQICMLIG